LPSFFKKASADPSDHLQTDPLTGLIDLDLLGGQSTHQRKLRGDLRREVVALLGSRDKGFKWTELLKALEAQSSIPIEHGELTDVIKSLESEGSVRVSGAAHARTIRLVGGAQAVEV
jgi:DNA replication licensing factor MCM4